MQVKYTSIWIYSIRKSVEWLTFIITLPFFTDINVSNTYKRGLNRWININCATLQKNFYTVLFVLHFYIFIMYFPFFSLILSLNMLTYFLFSLTDKWFYQIAGHIQKDHPFRPINTFKALVFLEFNTGGNTIIIFNFYFPYHRASSFTL